MNDGYIIYFFEDFFIHIGSLLYRLYPFAHRCQGYNRIAAISGDFVLSGFSVICVDFLLDLKLLDLQVQIVAGELTPPSTEEEYNAFCE